MSEHPISARELAAALEVNASTISRWKQGKRSILFINALRLANFFNCSLEFLLGRAENKLDFVPQSYPPFYERLHQIMEVYGVTWYRIVKDGIVSDHNLSVWKNGTSPYLQSVVDIADYFGLTLDHFVGRES